MEKHLRPAERLLNQRGVTALMVAAMMVVFLGLAALAVDVGFTLVTRNQLQNISDAASLAATRKLGSIYESMSYTDQQSYDAGTKDADKSGVKDVDDIIAIAQNVASMNAAAGKNITINPADVIIGQWKKDPADNKMKLFETLSQPDAVRVIARRDSSATSAEGPITTFFAKIFGKDTLDVRAGATAALTGESTAEEGGLPVPIGVSQVLADRGSCGTKIKMHPTKDSCAGWHTFTSATHSSHQLETILQDMLPASMRDKQYASDPNFISPEVSTYNTMINFTGGDLASNFTNFENLFNYMKTRDGDGDDTIWTTAIVIYKETATECGNPTGDTEIVGFATMKISIVLGASEKEIWGEIICNYVDTGRGGGGSYGTKGSIPGLVE